MFTGCEILKILPDAECAVCDFSVSSVLTDTRNDCSGALFVALSGENFDGHEYLDKAIEAGASALMVSANFAKDNDLPDNIPIMLVNDTLKSYQSLARAHREKMPCTLIAITGSSGKTSTKEIIKAIFVCAFGNGAVLATEGNTNNHIGVPQNLFRLTEKHRFAVIEMGSNHPGEIEVLAKIALPDVAVITSIGNAHIEFFKDKNGVAREKSAIFAAYPDSSGGLNIPVAVFPAQGEGNDVLRKQAEGVFYTFADRRFGDSDLIFEYLGGNLHGSSFRFINTSSMHWSEKIQWSLQGAHQASNASAAALAALAVGVSEQDIERAFKECSLPGMRMSISESNGITWINDAYNANPDSVKATLNWLAEFADLPNVKVVLGDMLEIGDTSALFHKQILEYALEKLPQSMIFGVGAEMSRVVSANPELQNKIICYRTSGEAGKCLESLVRSGDIVFLKGSRGIQLEKIQR